MNWAIHHSSDVLGQKNDDDVHHSSDVLGQKKDVAFCSIAMSVPACTFQCGVLTIYVLKPTSKQSALYKTDAAFLGFRAFLMMFSVQPLGCRSLGYELGGPPQQ